MRSQIWLRIFVCSPPSVDIQLAWLPHCKDNKSKAFFQIFFQLFLVVLIFLTRVLKVLIRLEFDEKCIIFANVKQINKIKYGKKLQDTLGFEVAEKVKANFQWLR